MTSRLWLVSSLLVVLGAPAAAALPDPPHQTIHFLAEHVPEIAQDARGFTLPWPATGPTRGLWQGSLQAGYLHTASGFLDIQGPLLAADASYGLSDRWMLEGTLFYGSFEIGDATSDEVLWTRFLAPEPLDLPEVARFSNTGGTIRHNGVGLALLRRLSSDAARHPLTLRVGLLFERLEAQDFQLHYRLLGGRDAGAQGILDHSFDTSFLTPHIGLQQEFPLGKSWRLRPRLSFGYPMPPAKFDGRLTGPGFDRSSRDPGGRPEKVGDPYFAAGAGLLHRPSGLEIDLGSTLYFGLFGEHLLHTSAENPLLLQITWHFR